MWNLHFDVDDRADLISKNETIHILKNYCKAMGSSQCGKESGQTDESKPWQSMVV